MLKRKLAARNQGEKQAEISPVFDETWHSSFTANGISFFFLLFSNVPLFFSYFLSFLVSDFCYLLAFSPSHSSLLLRSKRKSGKYSIYKKRCSAQCPHNPPPPHTHTPEIGKSTDNKTRQNVFDSDQHESERGQVTGDGWLVTGSWNRGMDRRVESFNITSCFACVYNL